MSEYMEATGRVYKNHLATMRIWASKEKKEKGGYDPSKYTFNEGESL